MILGFMDQFVSMVEDGSKTHSIRSGNRWRKGMRADLYARPRQPGMRLLFRAPVLKVEPITIMSSLSRTGLVPLSERTTITIAGSVLSPDESDMFAYRDGFRRPGLRPVGTPEHWGCFQEMCLFWQCHHDIERKPFRGQVVYWSFDLRFQRLDEDEKNK